MRDENIFKTNTYRNQKNSPEKEKYAFDLWGVRHLDYIKITFKKCLCTESIKLFTFVGYNR